MKNQRNYLGVLLQVAILAVALVAFLALTSGASANPPPEGPVAVPEGVNPAGNNTQVDLPTMKMLPRVKLPTGAQIKRIKMPTGNQIQRGPKLGDIKVQRVEMPSAEQLTSVPQLDGVPVQSHTDLLK